MKSYAYAHRFGVRRVTWEDFASLSRHLAELLEPFAPQVILGIARAGLFPATAVACSLRRELFPIRLSRRVNDEVFYTRPVWRVPVPAEVAGKVVAVIDEIADTGETLSMVAQSTLQTGAARVLTASLISHSWAKPMPQITSLVSDEFIIFPWDELVLQGGKWVMHPEVAAGLDAQPKRSKD
jgi:hypoxanthine phosphoribosyltransferase